MLFSLVSSYLEQMGYRQTLQTLKDPQSDKQGSVGACDQKTLEFESPTIERKMTIDQNDQSLSERKLDSAFSKAESAKKSVASKSQLSLEDEKMI